MRVTPNLGELIGQTPLYRSKSLSTDQTHVLMKLEMFNPMKHIHDRTVKGVIDQAEKDGRLHPGEEIIDASIGNYGISLAFYAGLKGYLLTIVVPDCVNVDLINMLRSLGANVVFSDGDLGYLGALSLAEEIVESSQNQYVMLRGANAIGNQLAHQFGTGKEIWNQTNGEVTAFVCGYFSGGTVSGVSAYLKQQNSSVKTILVEPSKSAVFAGKRPEAHNFADIGPGHKPELLDNTKIDDVIVVNENQAKKIQAQLAKKEGLFLGFASSLQAYAAYQYAQLNPNECVVTVAQTYGERFISTVSDYC